MSIINRLALSLHFFFLCKHNEKSYIKVLTNTRERDQKKTRKLFDENRTAFSSFGKVQFLEFFVLKFSPQPDKISYKFFSTKSGNFPH